MKPIRIFLTGEPGSGKTTAIRKAADLLITQGFKVGGIITTEMRESGTRVGFRIVDLSTKETGILAHINGKNGPRVGKYVVQLEDIERIAVGGIKRAILESNIIVVDELGPMELNSQSFIQSVEEALAACKHFVGTIHKRASHPFVTAIRSNPAYQILNVTFENRDQIPQRILERLRAEAA
jgi:nucleoside-triphosphatase